MFALNPFLHRPKTDLSSHHEGHSEMREMVENGVTTNNTILASQLPIAHNL